MGLGINVVVSVSYIAGGGWATFCASQIFAFRVKNDGSFPIRPIKSTTTKIIRSSEESEEGRSRGATN
jgi:hypothetical protein